MNIITVYEAAKRIRKATKHDEFTVSDLRHHMVCDSYAPATSSGKVYVERDYIDSLIYRLGKAGY